MRPVGPSDREGVGPCRTWAALLCRVFALDVVKCPCCGGRRRLVGVQTGGERLRALLERLGLVSALPSAEPSRSSPRASQKRTGPTVSDVVLPSLGASTLSSSMGVDHFIDCDIAAILDRILHHAITVNIRGNSYRLKEKLKAGLVRPAEATE